MKKYLTILLGTLCLAGCQGLTDLNHNPTKNTEVEPSLLITTAQFMPSQGRDETRQLLIYPGGWVNNWTGEYNSTHYGGKGIRSTRVFAERPWRYIYQQIIRPVVLAVDLTKEDPEMVNVHAAARLVRAENFLLLTDYYGDIPYSDVLKVYHDGSTVDPKYDTQESIYKDLLKECREAVAEFDTAKPGLRHDMYFGGDVARWKKFGASLWLRIAMRLVRVEPALAQSEAEAAIAAGLMEGNDDTAMVRHEGPRSLSGPSNGFANYMFEAMDQGKTQGTSAFQVTAEMVEALEGDPRLTILGRNYLADGTDVTEKLYAATREYKGQPAQYFYYSNALPELTLADGTKVGRYARYLSASNWVMAEDAPFIHLSYAETEFLRAEAALNGWAVDGSVEEHYKKGVVAAIEQWSAYGAPVPDRAALETLAEGFAGRFVSGKDRTDILEELNKQLWILHAMNPVECWSNIRRTEMPSKYVMFKNAWPTENESDGKRPNRVFYPVDEQKKNAANYKEAIGRMGGKDDWLHPMWWQGGEYK